MFFSRFRLRAFVLHLVLSLSVACACAVLVFRVWHPAPLDAAVGVTGIFLMMLGIDAVLGPLLTLAVAKEGKKSLKFDLSVIILLQLAALLYGLHSIAFNRPVYVAFDTFRFDLVQAGSIPAQSLEKAAAPYRRLGFGRADQVAVRPPADDAERNRRLFEELQTGVAPSMQPDLYEPLPVQQKQIIASMQPLKELEKFNPPDAVARIVQDYPQAGAWLPLKASDQDMTVLLDKQGGILGIVDLRPW